MGPEIQLTMVARLYIMRSIYDSTRSWLLLVDMSCAMLDKNVVEDRKKREYGSEQGQKRMEWTKGKSILELLKDYSED